jgi:hypothetical protein
MIHSAGGERNVRRAGKQPEQVRVPKKFLLDFGDFIVNSSGSAASIIRESVN